MKLILASRSPDRKKALDILGLEYDIIPSQFDEKSIRDEDPYVLNRKLSEAKAREVAKKVSDAIIVSGDLFVVFDNKIYEKPRDNAEAKEMLKSFSGNTVDILASVSVYNTSEDTMRSVVDKNSVTFRHLRESEIDDYINRYPVTDFAAGFDSDGVLRFTERFQGKYPLIISAIPMNELITFLRENGLDV
ncbi:MAG: Maf family protein [Candidatus Woesearchaeota archaeon]